MTREDLTLLSLWLHVPFVTAWIGLAMVDAFAMLAPGLGLDQRARLIAWSRPFVWVAIPVIITTGVWQTINNPYTQITSIGALETLRATTVYGQALFLKHAFVFATFALTIYVRFSLAPRLATAAALPAGDATAGVVALERTVRRLSILNAATCFATLLFATRMIYSLH